MATKMQRSNEQNSELEIHFLQIGLASSNQIQQWAETASFLDICSLTPSLWTSSDLSVSFSGLTKFKSYSTESKPLTGKLFNRSENTNKTPSFADKMHKPLGFAAVGRFEKSNSIGISQSTLSAPLKQSAELSLSKGLISTESLGPLATAKPSVGFAKQKRYSTPSNSLSNIADEFHVECDSTAENTNQVKISGEVTRPDTLNYRSFKPEKNGLFCERIFGPVNDWACACGQIKESAASVFSMNSSGHSTKSNIAYQNHEKTLTGNLSAQRCPNCFVEITSSRFRRYRMGYISLACPVTHIWYLNSRPNFFALLLKLPTKYIKRIAYYKTYVPSLINPEYLHSGLGPGGDFSENEWEFLHTWLVGTHSHDDLFFPLPKPRFIDSQFTGSEPYIVGARFDEVVGGAGAFPHGPKNIQVGSQRFSPILQSNPGVFDSSKPPRKFQYKMPENPDWLLHTGATALQNLLTTKSWVAESQRLGYEIEALTNSLQNIFTQIPLKEKQFILKRRKRRIRLFKILQTFQKSGFQFSGMIFSSIPVLPPDLRPIIQLGGGQLASSDVNDLYRRILSRNNRLKYYLYGSPGGQKPPEELSSPGGFEKSNTPEFDLSKPVESKILDSTRVGLEKKLNRVQTLNSIQFFQQEDSKSQKHRPSAMNSDFAGFISTESKIAYAKQHPSEEIARLASESQAVSVGFGYSSEPKIKLNEVVGGANQQKKQSIRYCSANAKPIHFVDFLVRSEQQLVQLAVDALLENGKTTYVRHTAGVSSPGRLYTSLSDRIGGKQGRFRMNLLGKRVDYSGRSVIVVGPELKISQCGLPYEMAIELFQPFVLRHLLELECVKTMRAAKNILRWNKSLGRNILHRILQGHPILLNRAPTLHRLGIQAFQPILVFGRGIHLHPLVCPSFNADFDGDQMAVHIPLSPQARTEARLLMLASNHWLSSSTGQPNILPSQDIILGFYFVSLEKAGYTQGRGLFFRNTTDVLQAYETGSLDLHSQIWIQNFVKSEPEFDLSKMPTLVYSTKTTVDKLRVELGSASISTSSTFGSAEDALDLGSATQSGMTLPKVDEVVGDIRLRRMTSGISTKSKGRTLQSGESESNTPKPIAGSTTRNAPFDEVKIKPDVENNFVEFALSKQYANDNRQTVRHEALHSPSLFSTLSKQHRTTSSTNVSVGQSPLSKLHDVSTHFLQKNRRKSPFSVYIKLPFSGDTLGKIGSPFKHSRFFIPAKISTEMNPVLNSSQRRGKLISLPSQLQLSTKSNCVGVGHSTLSKIADESRVEPAVGALDGVDKDVAPSSTTENITSFKARTPQSGEYNEVENTFRSSANSNSSNTVSDGQSPLAKPTVGSTNDAVEVSFETTPTKIDRIRQQHQTRFKKEITQPMEIRLNQNGFLTKFYVTYFWHENILFRESTKKINSFIEATTYATSLNGSKTLGYIRTTPGRILINQMIQKYISAPLND